MAWSSLVWPIPCKGLKIYAAADVTRTGLVWTGLAWYGQFWPGLAWSGLVWPGLEWSGPASFGLDLPDFANNWLNKGYNKVCAKM